MKKVIQKTEKERREEEKTEITLISVNDLSYYFWVCDKCHIAYFADDKIYINKQLKKLCPNFKTNFWGKKKICLGQLTGGEKECFDKYYKIDMPNA